MVKKVLATFVLALGLAVASTAFAVPNLQVYIEGATYDDATDTWVLSGTGTYKLWVIANNENGGILDVNLAAAVLTSELGGGSISLTGTTTGGLGGFTDPSAAANPVYSFTSADGAIPVLSDGSSLPSHGIYGAGTSFIQWSLGDMDLDDSPIGDFISAFPAPLAGQSGTINVYDVTVTGFTRVHFDVFNHFEGATHALNNPFSHDGESGGNGGNGGQAAEPTTMFLLGGGLLGALAVRRRK
jgi:hypothetical protein